MIGSNPPSGTTTIDEPPLYFGGGSDLEHRQPSACREYPAVRRILGTRGPQKAGSPRHARNHRRTQRRPLRWEEESTSLAADSNIVLPSDRRRSSITINSSHGNHTSNRRTPRLIRQEAFCESSTSRNWRSLDFVHDDEELYRLGLLYDESRDHCQDINSIRGSTWTSANDETHSARFSFDAISHSDPTYTVRMVSARTGQRNRRSEYRYDHGNNDHAGSDHDSEDEQHKGELLRAPPTLTLDLSFTAFADNVHQAWPRRGCQDDGYNHHTPFYHASQQPVQHIIYELDESDRDHDMTEGNLFQRPGTPITQTPELVSDDEDIASDDADWFSLMEDGWTPIEEVGQFETADKASSTSPHHDLHEDAAANDTWVLLGRGKT